MSLDPQKWIAGQQLEHGVKVPEVGPLKWYYHANIPNALGLPYIPKLVIYRTSQRAVEGTYDCTNFISERDLIIVLQRNLSVMVN